jgi:hypothetical protein
VFVGVGAAVEGLDVLGVEADGGCGVLDDLLPIAERIVAGGPVRVVDRVGLAEDSLGVEPDRLLEVLGPVGLVTGLLQLLCVLLALGFGESLDGRLVDLGQFVGGLDRCGLWRGGGDLGLLGGCCRLLGFCFPLCLLPFPPLLLAELWCRILWGNKQTLAPSSKQAIRLLRYRQSG